MIYANTIASHGTWHLKLTTLYRPDPRKPSFGGDSFLTKMGVLAITTCKKPRTITACGRGRGAIGPMTTSACTKYRHAYTSGQNVSAN
jgi:hypothetical protein